MSDKKSKKDKIRYIVLTAGTTVFVCRPKREKKVVKELARRGVTAFDRVETTKRYVDLHATSDGVWVRDAKIDSLSHEKISE